MDKRFDTRKITLEENDAAFDLLRASVNLMLASSLIALGTSLKLPLSTTYVTFMVAMGSSLADRAWSRESAVYRITGVLSVIGGWFATAIVAKFILFAVVIGFLIRSNLKTRESKKDKTTERFDKILTASPNTPKYPLIQEYSRDEWSEVLNWSAECYKNIVTSFLREDLSGLRSAHKQIKILKKHIERNRRHGSICTEMLANEDMVNKNFFLYQANDFMGDMLFSLQQISAPCKSHVDNNFTPMSMSQRKVLLRFAEEVQAAMDNAADMVSSLSFERYEGVRNMLLYLTILYETKALLDAVASFAKASRKFMTEKTTM